MKKRIGIECLLQWAFRDELPKGLPVTATPWEAIGRYATLGVRIDASRIGHGDPLGCVPGEPHPDALAVGAAVRRLPSAAAVGDGGDPLAAMRDILGHWYDLDPDAAARVATARFNPAAIVIHYAVMGRAPEWDVGSPVPGPQLRPSNGRPIVMGVDRDGALVVLAANSGRRAAVEPYNFWQAPRSPLRWDNPSVAALAEARAEFSIWHAALRRLAAALSGVLCDHDVLSPASPPTPWLCPAAPPRPVVSSTRVAPHAIVPLAPDRRQEAIARELVQRREAAALRRAERKRLRDESRAARAAIEGKGAKNRQFYRDCTPAA
jgi:hypothetical protein